MTGSSRTPEAIPLWAGAPPGTEHWTHQEGVSPPFNTPDVRNVSNPSLLAYLPDPAIATGTGIIASNDNIAVQSCLDLYTSWWSAGHSAEMHIYADGGHGFGMRKHGLASDTWIDRFGDWLDAQGLLTPQRLVAAER